MKVVHFILFLSLSIAGCKKTEVGPQRVDGKPYFKEGGTKILIGCEGNFGTGNASLSLYNSETRSVTNDLYFKQNNLPLGDVLQSSTLFNGDLYVVVNNSNKIQVLDTSNFVSKGIIDGLTSPRYFLGVSDSKGYVTDLYSNSIQVVNLNTYQITSTIPVSAWTEQLILVNGKVYVTQKGTDQILVIDINNDVLSDSITVGREPNSIVMDIFQNLWVLCSGGINESNPQLLRINTISNTVSETFIFNSVSESPNKLTIDTSGLNLFFLNDGLFKTSVVNPSLNSPPFISSNNSIFYGLGIDPFNNDLYLTDAVDYIQAGKVYRYNFQATPIDTISVGLIPQDFTFLDN